MFIRQHPELTSSSQDVHGHETRQSADLRVPKCRTDYFGKGCLCTAVRTYNKLPLYIKQAPETKKFKSLVKDFLVSNEFYNLS